MEAHEGANIDATGKDGTTNQRNFGEVTVSPLTDADTRGVQDDCAQHNNCLKTSEKEEPLKSDPLKSEAELTWAGGGRERGEECEQTVREDDVPDRDGSDSGLGSDTTCGELRTVPAADDDSDDDKFLSELISCSPRAPRLATGPGRSNLKRKAGGEEEPTAKRPRKSITFDSVTVYYFPRTQGFTCVPSQGGSTLGMEQRHSHVHTFTLHEHALEQRRLHRQLLQQLRSERLQRVAAALSSDDSDDEDEEEASDTSESELDLDGYYFLQPVPTRQRRALLRAAGVRRVDPHEKDECRDIRLSREFCGCSCKGACDPAACSCSIAGIKCQVDRLNFPCGCTHDACANTAGRIEFNPVRVQTHFIRTLVRLGLERSEEEQSRRAAEQSWHGAAASAYSDLHTLAPVAAGVHASDYARSHLTEMTMGTQVDAYASASNQVNGPPYNSGGAAYDSSQRFSCDLGGYQYPDGHFEGFHSYSATSFEEFAHPAHISMFNHYGHMYVPEYIPKPEPHYTSVALSYDAPERCQYPAAGTSYPGSEREETASGGDENWFSGESAVGVEAAVVDPAPAAPPTSEDFGEIIKKTMVESVIG